MKLTKTTHNNFYRLQHDGKQVWFSYEVPIGLSTTIPMIINDVKTVFAVSNGKFTKQTSYHQNLLDIDKKHRVSHDELINLIERNF